MTTATVVVACRTAHPDEMTALAPAGTSNHRADLAGLRGLAVLLVLVYHFDLPPFQGGFIGVDIFFVLSGYLITANTQRALHSARFSFSAFYYRRITRLAPALFSTLLLSGIVSPLLWPALDARDASISGAAAAVGLSNVAFFLRSGYFDSASLRKPLLHTWSLSLEAQFYLLWAPLHFFLFALDQRMPLLTAAAGTLIGAAAAERAAILHPSAAFFLLHHRAWEFLAGATLALLESRMGRSPTHSRLLAHATALSGLGLLLAAAIALRPTDIFPGHRALLPVLTTTALIALPTDTAAGRLLALRPLTYLGEVSYSVYLVHWPVLVHLRTGLLGRPMPVLVRVSTLLGALVFGAVLHITVERPWMARGAKIVPLRFFVRFALLAAGLAGALAALAVGLGARDEAVRLHAEVALLDIGSRASLGGVDAASAVALAKTSRKPRNAKWEYLIPDFSYEITLRPEKTTARPPRVLVVGDSHAGRLRPLVTLARDRYGAVAQLWAAMACPPLFGVRKTYRFEPKLEAECRKTISKWKRRLLAERFDIIVLAARWSNLVERGMYGGNFNIDFLVPLEEPRETSITSNRARVVNRSRTLLVKSLRDTAREIASHGAKVVIIGQIPVLAKHPRECAGGAECAGVSREMALARLAFSDAAVHRAATKLRGVQSFAPSDMFCEEIGSQCSVRVGKALLYEDKDHLSILGGAYLSLRLENMVFRGLKKVD